MSRFSCPHCGKTFKWKSELVGRHAKCSSCQQRITIPESPTEESGEVELIETSKPIPAAAPTPVKNKTPRPIVASMEHLNSDNEPAHAEGENKTNRWIQWGVSALVVVVLIAVRVVPRELRRMERRAQVEQEYTADLVAENASPEEIGLPPISEIVRSGQVVAAGQPDGASTLSEEDAAESPEEIEFASAPTPPKESPSELDDIPSVLKSPNTKEDPKDKPVDTAPTKPKTRKKPTVPKEPTETSNEDFHVGDPSKIRFELFEANVIDIPNRPFGGLAPDFGISMKYRIKPTEEIINVHIYRVKLRINNSEHDMHISDLRPEGQVQIGFRVFGIDKGVQGAVTAWVEQVDPNTSQASRVSEVVTLGRTSVVPQPAPPPLATATKSSLKFDRTLPPAMKAAHEKFKKEMAEKKRPATEDELDDVLAQLEGSDQFKMRDALQKLQNTPSKPQYRERVGEALENLFESSDGFVRADIFKTLKVWPSEVTNKLILEGLADESFVVHGEALKAISNPKNIPNLDQALVDLALEHGKEHEIEPILIKLGPSAEKETLRLLDSRDKGRVKLGLKVLAKIGGKASIEPIEEVADHSDVFTQRDADDALRSIKRRMKK